MRVEVRDLRRRFGSVTALDGVSFEVPEGRRVAVIGPNGSGKSTLMRAVLGLIAFEGAVRLDGRSPFEHRAALAHRLAYVPQTAPQLAAPVGEVVDAVTRIRALRQGAVADTAARIGLDVAAVATRPVRGLSGGTRQKLMIALALAGRPSLVVMDEPTASLDAPSRESFFRLYHQAAAGATLLLCSHRLEEVSHLVESVIALDGGRVTFDGPVESFLETRSHGVLEVWARSDTDRDWFTAHGFVHGKGGSWLRVVTRDEKLALLRELTVKCNGHLTNLVVRDLETLDVPSSGEE
jgi:ABC-2 type transport system ATP-binding protein